MKTTYYNWCPLYIIKTIKSITIVLWILTAIVLYQYVSTNELSTIIWFVIVLISACIALFMYVRFTYMYHVFDFDNKNGVSWKIIHFVSDHMQLEPNSKILDVGCGSGALTIDVAKKNRGSSIVGCDRWGKDYKDFSKNVCLHNADVEGVNNITFVQGDATHLPFKDNEFDGLVSNYVYHNIPGNRTSYLVESLRCLKPGGKFAIHDIFIKAKYGDLDQVIKVLKENGVKELKFIDTTDGTCMTIEQATKTFCKGSKLLVGHK